MFQPMISLVIPFYNVEKYIAQCLDSVYNQDISEEQYEVICVNDASPDNSREIVLEYQKKHTNLKLVGHQFNKKLGAARNTGRAIVRGKYIWNIDSDDYIKPNVLKTLIETCETYNLDILIFNFDRCIKDTQQLNMDYPFPNSQCFKGIEFLNKYCLNHFSEISPVWTQVYSMNFLNLNNIYSPENNYGEDAPYTLKAMLLAKRVISIKQSCYVYRYNENSIGATIETNPTAKKLYEKCFTSTKDLSKLIKIIPKNERELISRFKSYVNILFLFSQNI